MRKIVLVAIAVLTFGWANAQDVRFGIKGSMNLPNFRGDIEGVDLKSKIAFNGGAFTEFKISDKFFIQPELLYSEQGAKIEYLEDDYKYTQKIRLGYLNIPLMAKFYVVDKLSFEVGPQIGFLLSAKSKIEEIYKGEKYSETENIKNNAKSVDFGFNFGAGYDFTNNLSVGARYNLGLINVAKDFENLKLKNSVFSLSVGYKF